MHLPSGLLPFALAALAPLAASADQIPLQRQSSSNSPITSIPQLGFGTWRLDKSNASEAVALAIQTGYTHIDCAAIYGNEVEVGKGIAEGLRRSGRKREDIWVTSKLWNDHHNPADVSSALSQTLSDLGLDYLDLYLMHWPVSSQSSPSHPSGGNYISYMPTWLAMAALLNPPATAPPNTEPRPLARHVGVSNFSPAQLKDLIAKSEEARVPKPAVHQFELHPYLQQRQFLSLHAKLGINVTAYSPLANLNYNPNPKGDAPPSILENDRISEIAEKRGCTNAQVALQWGMRGGWSVIPKSQHADRIEENYKAKECMLTKEDESVMLEVGEQWVKRFNNPSKGWGVPLYEGLDDA